MRSYSPSVGRLCEPNVALQAKVVRRLQSSLWVICVLLTGLFFGLSAQISTKNNGQEKIK